MSFDNFEFQKTDSLTVLARPMSEEVGRCLLG